MNLLTGDVLACNSRNSSALTAAIRVNSDGPGIADTDARATAGTGGVPAADGARLRLTGGADDDEDDDATAGT